MNKPKSKQGSGLTEKQIRFVAAFCGSAKFNCTKAALEAGYSATSAHNIGWENVRKREIAEAISKRMDEFAMSQTEAIARIGQMARGELPTKEVHRATAEDGVLATEEFNQESALDKVLKLTGAYAQPEHQDVKFLLVRSLDEVEPSLPPPRAPKS